MGSRVMTAREKNLQTTTNKKASKLPGIACLTIGTIFASVTYAGAGTWLTFFLAMVFLLVGMAFMARHDKAVATGQGDRGQS
jgi:hypothetical protein